MQTGSVSCHAAIGRLRLFFLTALRNLAALFPLKPPLAACAFSSASLPLHAFIPARALTRLMSALRKAGLKNMRFLPAALPPYASSIALPISFLIYLFSKEIHSVAA